MKIYKSTLLLILVLMLMSVAYASQNNSHDSSIIEKTEITNNLDQEVFNQISDKEKSGNKIVKIDKQENDISNNKKTAADEKFLTDDEIDDINNTGDCSTVIMQVSENEAVLSFRRDSTGSTINIYVSNNSSYIRQYKTSGSYFFHVLVSKDGWMAGNGGADNARVNKLIESRALSIIKSKTITRTDLNYIANLQRQLGLGHFIIKAPDGNYGSIVYRNGAMINTGKLNPGEYIVCPNSKTYYRKGNYISYAKTTDPVKASRLITLKDPFGVNRRNIMTYHFKRNETTSNIDFYAGNDNGAYVGRSTKYLRDNIVTSTKTVAATNLPTSADGMFIQRYTYIVNASYKPKVDFMVTTNKNTTKMDNNITLIAKLKIDDKLVNNGYVIFKINGITLKDKNNQNIKAYLKNGWASINYTIPDGWSAKPVKVTSVFSRSNYGRIENKTYFNITRTNIHMQLNNITSKTRQIHITGKILDEHNHTVVGENIISVKVSGLTIKSNNKTIYFKAVNGTIDITFNLPDNYKKGNYTIILSTGTRNAYNANRSSCKLNLLI